MKIGRIARYLLIATVIVSYFFVAGCGTIRIGNASFGYDLKGAQIDPKCKTAFVDYFKNQAENVQPSLALKLTDKLKDKLLSQTHLKLTNSTGDVNFIGVVEKYQTEPIAPQAGAQITAAMVRLTITINVKYTNAIDSKWEYETSFSRFLDYPATQNLNTVENSTDYDAVLDQLIQDIFDKAFVNW